MIPLAHHAGEQSLATLLLLASSGALWVMVAIGRAHLTAARAKLTRKRRGPVALLDDDGEPLTSWVLLSRALRSAHLGRHR
jgi:hypothetical protein